MLLLEDLSQVLVYLKERRDRRVLLFLQKTRSPQTIKQIAHEVGSTKSLIEESITRLIADGHPIFIVTIPWDNLAQAWCFEQRELAKSS